MFAELTLEPIRRRARHERPESTHADVGVTDKKAKLVALRDRRTLIRIARIIPLSGRENVCQTICGMSAPGEMRLHTPPDVFTPQSLLSATINTVSLSVSAHFLGESKTTPDEFAGKSLEKETLRGGGAEKPGASRRMRTGRITTNPAKLVYNTTQSTFVCTSSHITNRCDM